MSPIATLSLSLQRTLMVAGIAGLVTGCPKRDADPEPTPQPSAQTDRPALSVVQGLAGIIGTLDVNLDQQVAGVLMTIRGAPADATLRCELNREEFEPCHDEALILTPPAGEYWLRVVALRDDIEVARGDARLVIHPPAAPSQRDETQAQPSREDGLALVLVTPQVRQEQTINRRADLRFQVRHAAEPPCSEPTYQCALGSETSLSWFPCDPIAGMTLPSRLLAAGRQTIAAQAYCGDTLGGALKLTVYGVEPDYEALAVQLTSVGQPADALVAHLQRALDCPLGDLRFECRRSSRGSFARCEEGNMLRQPQPGAAVRARCGDQIGPITEFAPAD